MTSLQVVPLTVEGKPLHDAYDLEVFVGSKSIARMQDCWASDVTVEDVKPTDIHRIELRPLRYRHIGTYHLGGGRAEILCPINPERAIPKFEPPEDDLLLPLLAEWEALTTLEKATLCNIHTKMSLLSLWQYVRGIYRVEQDRIFATVNPYLAEEVQSVWWVKVSDALHHPPTEDAYLRLGSYKERKPLAGGLQITFFYRAGIWTADIDIDNSTGLEHAFDVIDHWVSGEKTHPYDIHQILLSQGIDPGYRLVPDAV